MLREITLSVLLGLLLWPAATPQVAIARDANHDPMCRVAPALQSEGVPNFHKVTKNFYRGGQPSPSGFEFLSRQCGIRTVISLRVVGRDELTTEGLSLPLHLKRFPIHTWSIERDRANVVAALRALRLATLRGPTLLHCEHGSDRTGLVTALYRILYQHWSKRAALNEMKNGGFHFNKIWWNIPRFIKQVDVAQLRREVGVR